MIARAKNLFSTDEIRKQISLISEGYNSPTYRSKPVGLKTTRFSDSIQMPSYPTSKESVYTYSKYNDTRENPDLDPKRNIDEVDGYDIDWESGPIGRDAQIDDIVIYCGHNPLLVNGGEYKVYLVHDFDMVDLVRTDNQNFTYSQSVVRVNNNSLYWRRGDYDY